MGKPVFVLDLLVSFILKIHLAWPSAMWRRNGLTRLKPQVLTFEFERRGKTVNNKYIEVVFLAGVI